MIDNDSEPRHIEVRYRLKQNKVTDAMPLPLRSGQADKCMSWLTEAYISSRAGFNSASSKSIPLRSKIIARAGELTKLAQSEIREGEVQAALQKVGHESVPADHSTAQASSHLPAFLAKRMSVATTQHMAPQVLRSKALARWPAPWHV